MRDKKLKKQVLVERAIKDWTSICQQPQNSAGIFANGSRRFKQGGFTPLFGKKGLLGRFSGAVYKLM